jgi:hypothetical protein
MGWNRAVSLDKNHEDRFICMYKIQRTNELNELPQLRLDLQ